MAPRQAGLVLFRFGGTSSGFEALLEVIEAHQAGDILEVLGTYSGLEALVEV